MNTDQNDLSDAAEIGPEGDSSSVPTTIISLIIGAFVLLAIPALAVFLFIHFKKSPEKTTTISQVATISQTVLQTDTQNQPKNTGQIRTTNKPYTDNSGYIVQIPASWETFLRAGDGTAHQIGLRPVGSADVPVVINSVTNANGKINDWITMQFGANYPKTTQVISGNSAMVVKNGQTTSYFFSKNGNLYQLSCSTVRNDYATICNQILSSLSL